VVELLLGKGADVNAQGGERYDGNALQAASFGGHEKVVELLLGKGADVNAHGGGTALQAASVGGHEKGRAAARRGCRVLTYLSKSLFHRGVRGST
jgi:ankyrin repeat protein